MLAADADVDLAHAVPLSLLDVVDQVQLARLLEKSWVGLDVGEDKAAAAVDVADHAEVGIHLRLIERLAAGELEIPRDEFTLELAVADERHVADRIPRPLVDHEGEHRPLAFAAIDHLHLAADLGLEESETAVVGGERLDVGVDLAAVEIAAEQPEHTGLRLDLREQAGIGRDGVADEARPQRLAAPPLVDEKYRPLVARLAPLDRGHFRSVIPLFVVVRLDSPTGLLDHVGVHGITHFDLGLLADRAGRHPLVADVLDIPQHRPLDDLEDHDHALLDADVLGVDVDKLTAAMERADILFDRLCVEDLAGTGDELGQLRDVGGMVTLDPHLDDAVGLVDRRGRGGCRLRQGRDGPRHRGHLTMGDRCQAEPCGGERHRPQALGPSVREPDIAMRARVHQWCRWGEGRQWAGEEYRSHGLRHKAKSVLRSIPFASQPLFFSGRSGIEIPRIARPAQMPMLDCAGQTPVFFTVSASLQTCTAALLRGWPAGCMAFTTVGHCPCRPWLWAWLLARFLAWLVTWLLICAVAKTPVMSCIRPCRLWPRAGRSPFRLRPTT